MMPIPPVRTSGWLVLTLKLPEGLDRSLDAAELNLTNMPSEDPEARRADRLMARIRHRQRATVHHMLGALDKMLPKWAEMGSIDAAWRRNFEQESNLKLEFDGLADPRKLTIVSTEMTMNFACVRQAVSKQIEELGFEVKHLRDSKSGAHQVTLGAHHFTLTLPEGLDRSLDAAELNLSDIPSEELKAWRADRLMAGIRHQQRATVHHMLGALDKLLPKWAETGAALSRDAAWMRSFEQEFDLNLMFGSEARKLTIVSTEMTMNFACVPEAVSKQIEIHGIGVQHGRNSKSGAHHFVLSLPNRSFEVDW